MDLQAAKQWRKEARSDLDSAIRDKVAWAIRERAIRERLVDVTSLREDREISLSSVEQESLELARKLVFSRAVREYWAARLGCAVSLGNTLAGELTVSGIVCADYCQEFLAVADREIGICREELISWEMTISKGEELYDTTMKLRDLSWETFRGLAHRQAEIRHTLAWAG